MKKKILLVSHDFTVTGAPNSLLRQAKYLRNGGYEIDVLSLGDGLLKQRYLDEGFNPLIINNSFKSIDKFLKKHHNYDLVICNTIVTYKMIFILLKYKLPAIWFIRETKLIEEYINKNSLFKNLFTTFNNLYTVSEYASNVIKKYNRNVKFINNAIYDISNAVKEISIERNNEISFGYIGSLLDVKGVDLFVDAFLNLLKKYKNIKLYIAGGIINSEYINEMRKKTQDINNVCWLGEIQQEEKEKFFNKIDVLCIPSLDDPCPLTVIEGAMRAKALIATKNTGSNYIINDGKSGYIVETNSVPDLEFAMENIINSDIKKMQELSRKMYEMYGTTEREEREVLSMVADSLNKNNNNMRIDFYREWIKMKLSKFYFYICTLVIPVSEIRKKYRKMYKDFE